MVTGLYPLAQTIEQIGGGTVSVTDVVPTGADPRHYQLDPAQIAAVHHAALAVEVDGFQPSFRRPQPARRRWSTSEPGSEPMILTCGSTPTSWAGPWP